jgi:cupin domain-containing protein
MIIDFKDIAEVRINGFKGGQGELDTRNFADEKVKIMKSILKPGASSGLHTHEGNCEVMYILKGELTYHYDGKTEVAHAGQVHYCPMNHNHYFENLTTEDAEYLAIVSEHH